jgi:hypothetical protein
MAAAYFCSGSIPFSDFEMNLAAAKGQATRVVQAHTKTQVKIWREWHALIITSDGLVVDPWNDGWTQGPPPHTTRFAGQTQDLKDIGSYSSFRE